MKKFAVLMVFVMMLSATLAGCDFLQRDSGKVCDLVISPDMLQNYQGQKATLLGSYAGVTVLKIKAKNVCVTENGRYSTVIGQEVSLIVKTQYSKNQIGEVSFTLGHLYTNVYVGSVGTIHYVNGPVIVLDDIHEVVYKDSCTMLDENTISLLNGQEVKFAGVWSDKWVVSAVFEHDGQNYCYDNNIFAYKTMNIFGKPHHVESAFFFPGYGYYPWELQGNMGIITVVSYEERFPDIYFDVGEGQREFEADIMVEEIGSRDMSRQNLVYDGMFGETLTDGKGNVYGLMIMKEAPQLKSGYLISPKSYVYGGSLNGDSEIGEIDGKAVTILFKDKDCSQSGYTPISSYFNIEIDGKVIDYFDYVTNIEYLALIKGNGENQDIVYYKIDSNDFCSK